MVVDTASTADNGGLTTARMAACNSELALSGRVNAMPHKLASAEEDQTVRPSFPARCDHRPADWADQNEVDFHQAMDISGEAYPKDRQLG